MLVIDYVVGHLTWCVIPCGLEVGTLLLTVVHSATELLGPHSCHHCLGFNTELEGEETEIQGSKEKGKQKEERINKAEEEEEVGGQEEENGIESVEERSNSFSLVAYSVGTGAFWCFFSFLNIIFLLIYG